MQNTEIFCKDKKVEHGKNKQNGETNNLYISLNNYPVEKNPTAEPGIEPETSSSEGNEITIEQSGRVVSLFLGLDIIALSDFIGFL